MLFLLFYHCLVEPPCVREQDQPVHCGQDHRVQLSPERQQGDYDDYDDIYIMMSVCLFVCNKKSSLPPGSIL